MTEPQPTNKLRRRVLWAFVAVVGLVLVMAGVGATMEPSHVATRHAVYARTPDEVWDVITRFDRAPSWRTDVDAVELEAGDPIRFVEMGAQGPLPLEVSEQERPRKLVLMATDPSLPFTGSWTFELQPTDGGTRLTITERGSIDNPLFRFMARLFMDPSATATTYLVDLGHHFGEDVTPQPPGG